MALPYNIVQTISLPEPAETTHVVRLEVVMKLAWILSCSLGLAAVGCGDDVTSPETSGPGSSSSSSSASASSTSSSTAGPGGAGGESVGPGGAGGEGGVG